MKRVLMVVVVLALCILMSGCLENTVSAVGRALSHTGVGVGKAVADLSMGIGQDLQNAGDAPDKRVVFKTTEEQF